MGDTSLRDNQRSKLYKAERVALNSISSPLPTVKDVEKFVAVNLKRKMFERKFGAAVDPDWNLSVKDGRGTRKALAYGTYAISIPLWARTEWVVIHELAHVIHNRLSRGHEWRGGASHGWQFAAVYVFMVHCIMGKEASDALKQSFKAHRVRFRPKKIMPKREISPELVARMAHARAVRSKLAA